MDPSLLDEAADLTVAGRGVDRADLDGVRTDLADLVPLDGGEEEHADVGEPGGLPGHHDLLRAGTLGGDEAESHGRGADVSGQSDAVEGLVRIVLGHDLSLRWSRCPLVGDLDIITPRSSFARDEVSLLLVGPGDPVPGADTHDAAAEDRDHAPADEQERVRGGVDRLPDGERYTQQADREDGADDDPRRDQREIAVDDRHQAGVVILHVDSLGRLPPNLVGCRGIIPRCGSDARDRVSPPW